ncbi:MAG: alcohol dehydrogenase catalytic domain-containing protein [Paracoccus sp. (in: a-proteobacteria)]|nr:alcohol dehydrogenase catalytic domain-containing protein [Paracoccus sp. (in: a-proteobacteria)]
MRAVRLHGVRDLRLEEIPKPPPPGPGEVTLRVGMAGICGSDLHNYATGAWISRTPSVAGHELTGMVTALGAGVRHVRARQRVIVDSRHGCGTCPACTEGNPHVCAHLGFLGEVIDGGFAQFVNLPARNVLPAPEGVPDRHLVLAEPLAVALHALGLLAAPAGARIIITGCGPIGAFSALLATVQGHPVTVIDRNATRAALVAKATGAEIVALDDLGALRFRHALDTTGSAPVIRALLARIAGASRLALVGIAAPAEIIDPVYLVEHEIALLGCHAFADELPRIAGMLAGLGPQLDRLVATPIPLAEVPAAYEALLAGRAKGVKTLMDCQK